MKCFSRVFHHPLRVEAMHEMRMALEALAAGEPDYRMMHFVVWNEETPRGGHRVQVDVIMADTDVLADEEERNV